MFMRKMFFVLCMIAVPFISQAQFCWWEDIDTDVYPNICMGDFEVGEDFFIFKSKTYTGNEVTEIKWWLTKYTGDPAGEIVDPGETFITDEKVFTFSRTLEDYADPSWSYRLHLWATNLETGISDSAVFNYVNPNAYPPDVDVNFQEGEGYCELKLQLEMRADLAPSHFGFQVWTSTGDTLADHEFAPANPDYEGGPELTFDGELYDGVGIYVRMIAESDEGMDSLNMYALIDECSWNIFKEGEISNRPSVYPNPVNDFVFIVSNSASLVEVDNLSGKKVLSQVNDGKVYLGDLPRGMYFLVLYNNAGMRIHSQMILKQ